MLRKLWRRLRQQDLVDYQQENVDAWMGRYKTLLDDYQREKTRRIAAEAAAAATDSQAHQVAHHHRIQAQNITEMHRMLLQMASKTLVRDYIRALKNRLGSQASDPVLEGWTHDT